MECKRYTWPLTDMGEHHGCAGQDCFLLEPLFRNEAWGHMLAPVSEANERSVYVSMMEGCRAALQGYSTSIDDDLRALRDAQPGSRLEKAILVGVPAVLRISVHVSQTRCACVLRPGVRNSSFRQQLLYAWHVFSMSTVWGVVRLK